MSCGYTNVEPETEDPAGGAAPYATSTVAVVKTGRSHTEILRGTGLWALLAVRNLYKTNIGTAKGRQTDRQTDR